MITIRTMKQIATSRTIASFRAGSSLNRVQSASQDQARIVAGLVQAQMQESRRLWLHGLYWSRHG